MEGDDIVPASAAVIIDSSTNNIIISIEYPEKKTQDRK
jgi:hypothetical protein